MASILILTIFCPLQAKAATVRNPAIIIGTAPLLLLVTGIIVNSIFSNPEDTVEQKIEAKNLDMIQQNQIRLAQKQSSSVSLQKNY